MVNAGFDWARLYLVATTCVVTACSEGSVDTQPDSAFDSGGDGSVEAQPDSAFDSGDGGGGDATLDGSSDAGRDAADGGGDAADSSAAEIVPSRPCGSPSFTPTGGVTTILDFGHATNVELLARAGDRIVSMDSSGHWVLWDGTTGLQLANGTGTRKSASLRGGLLLVKATDYEVRGSGGQTLFTLPGATYAQAGLALDGSYVWAASSSGLSVFAPTGAARFTRPGAYAAADIFATGTELHVASGPAGATLIEKINSTTGVSAVTASFTGTFLRWFQEGERFFTSDPGLQRVYDMSAAQLDVLAFPITTYLGGSGDYYWTIQTTGGQNALEVSKIGTGGASPAEFTLARTDPPAFAAASGYLLAITDTGSTVIQLKASGPSPSAPRSAPSVLDAIAAIDDGGRFVVSDPFHLALYHFGTVADASRYGALGCGAPLDIGGSGASSTGAVAGIAFVTGTVAYDTRAQALTVSAHMPSGHVEVTADGTALVAAEPGIAALLSGDCTVRAFSLPSGAEIHAWPYAYGPQGGTNLFDFALAKSGSRLARVEGVDNNGWAYARHVTDLTGATDAYDDTGFGQRIEVSPDGSLLAIPSGDDPGTGANITQNPATRIYKDRVLVAGVTGYPAGWIDDNRLLVKLYTFPPPFRTATYDHSVVYDATGNFVANASIPRVDRFDYAGPSRLFSRTDGAVYDLGTGTSVWSGTGVGASSWRHGALAGPRVVFWNPSTSLIQSVSYP